MPLSDRKKRLRVIKYLSFKIIIIIIDSKIIIIDSKRGKKWPLNLWSDVDND